MQFYLFLLLLVSKISFAAAPPVKLLSMSGSAIGDSTLITLDLSAIPSWQNVEVNSHGVFIELILPGTVASTAGEFYDVDSPYVLKLMPIQSAANTTSLRMFVSEEGTIVHEAMTTEVAGKQIFITVDHRKLEKILTSTKTVSSTTTAPLSWKTSEGRPVELMEIFRYAGIWLIGIAGLAIFLLWLRWLTSRNSLPSRKSRDHSPLKIVGQLSLSSKQKLHLVEVLGQKMLFSVSTERVELLMKLTSGENFPQIMERVTESRIEGGLPTTVNKASNDLHLNQNNLSVQKSMQRSQYFRDTLSNFNEQPAKIEGSPTIRKNQAVNEVTDMIREKLSNLPSS